MFLTCFLQTNLAIPKARLNLDGVYKPLRVSTHQNWRFDKDGKEGLILQPSKKDFARTKKANALHRLDKRDTQDQSDKRQNTRKNSNSSNAKRHTQRIHESRRRSVRLNKTKRTIFHQNVKDFYKIPIMAEC